MILPAFTALSSVGVRRLKVTQQNAKFILYRPCCLLPTEGNKFGYGTGDFAANMVYGLISSFVMIYLTNTVGMNAAAVGTLIMLSKLLDGVTDIFFGSIIDRTKTKMGKARPWMLGSFIAYTLLNAVFYTANNISYSTLTALITKNGNERVQLGTFRFIGSTIGNLVVSNFTLVLVERFGGAAAGWKTTAIIFVLFFT